MDALRCGVSVGALQVGLPSRSATGASTWVGHRSGGRTILQSRGAKVGIADLFLRGGPGKGEISPCGLTGCKSWTNLTGDCIGRGGGGGRSDGGRAET